MNLQELQQMARTTEAKPNLKALEKTYKIITEFENGTLDPLNDLRNQAKNSIGPKHQIGLQRLNLLEILGTLAVVVGGVTMCSMPSNDLEQEKNMNPKPAIVSDIQTLRSNYNL